VPRRSSSTVLIATIGAGAVLLVIVVALVVSRPAPVTTATIDRSAVSVSTTTALPVSSWVLPEGGLAVDLPVPLAPSVPPSVPAPFVSAAAYEGASEGRRYVVATFAVHPAYRWEDTGRAFIDAVDTIGAEHGFTVISRSAGAFDQLPSGSFTFVASRGPGESDADFERRTDGDPTGEGIAVIDGNHLYLVAVAGESLKQAQFGQVRDSITVTSTPPAPAAPIGSPPG
jgi:hypothetical protein